MVRKYIKQDSSKGLYYERWTYQTLCCYKYEGHCELCPESIVCERIDTPNEYGIKPVKYAMLLTLAHVGKPQKGNYER